MEGGTWGGRHIQWAGSTYWAGANGQARWANKQASWANGQVGGRCVNGEGGRTGARCGLVCESNMGKAKVVGGHCGAMWGCVIVMPA